MITQITHPSQQPDGRDSILDHIWTNQLASVAYGEFKVNISNHYPIFVQLFIPCKSDRIVKTFRDHSSQSMSLLERAIAAALTETFLSSCVHLNNKVTEVSME